MIYAKGTKVSVAKTRIEIEAMLDKFGATSRSTAQTPGWAIIYFEARGWRVRIRIELPAAGSSRSAERLAQETREAWRQLLLVLKAKLVAIDNRAETFEQSFMAHILDAQDVTLGERLIPKLVEARDSGRLMLPSGGSDNGAVNAR